jgi:hypothetical protein
VRRLRLFPRKQQSLFAHFMDARFCGDEFERGSGFASAGFPVIR